MAKEPVIHDLPPQDSVEKAVKANENFVKKVEDASQQGMPANEEESSTTGP